MDETITISKNEYEKLKKDSIFLDHLKAHGVDNWQPGYDLAKEDAENGYGE